MKKAITHLKKADAVLASIIERAGAYKGNYIVDKMANMPLH
jgi:hypothetical protein